jgi:hypothetical protein
MGFGVFFCPIIKNKNVQNPCENVCETLVTLLKNKVRSFVLILG